MGLTVSGGEGVAGVEKGWAAEVDVAEGEFWADPGAPCLGADAAAAAAASWRYEVVLNAAARVEAVDVVVAVEAAAESRWARRLVLAVRKRQREQIIVGRVGAAAGSRGWIGLEMLVL